VTGGQRGEVIQPQEIMPESIESGNEGII
jgi:hypothetical protein